MENNKNSQATLKTKLKIIDFENISSTGSAQQECNEFDLAWGKIVDLLTPIVTKTVQVDRFEPSFVT